MNTYTQYFDYIKPTWAPPAWVFGPVWTVLYAIIAISFGYVFYKYMQDKVKGSLALPFLLNLLFNLSYTYIQFGLRNYILASVDIVIIWGTLVWFMVAVWKKYRWVAIANTPYLLWVSFATVLQLTITYLNH